MKNKLHLIHPFLVALAPVVFLWQKNFGEVPTREVIPALVISLILAGLAMLLLKIFFSNAEKIAIFASSVLFISLFFNNIYNTIFYNSFLDLRIRWTFLILVVFFVVFAYVIKKTQKDLRVINTLITLTAGIFIILSLVQLGVGYYESSRDMPGSNLDGVSLGRGVSEGYPDIYYIILDGYSSPDVIENVLGYEEIDSMVSYLESNGFYIAKESKTNYPTTFLSIPSSLNMQYLEDPEADKHHFIMAEDHKVKDILKSYGYKYFHFGANTFTYHNRYADQNINIGFLSPFQAVLWNHTIFKHIQDFTGTRFEGFDLLDTRLTQWKREKYKIEKLYEASEGDDPVFVFAHFLLPKGDNVFNKDGTYVTGKEARINGRIKGYIHQLEYINSEMKKVISDILENSQLEPVIIIQGDHGFPFYSALAELESFADPVRARELVVPGRHSFPILNTFYFPGGGDALLYDSITPVNTFRILFNYYFDQDLDLLEDISYTANPDNGEQFTVWDK